MDKDPIIVLGGHKMGTSLLYPLLATFSGMNKHIIKNFDSTPRSCKYRFDLPYYLGPVDTFTKNMKHDTLLFLRNGSIEWYKKLRENNFKKFIRVVRNPMSVLNSSYFSHKYSHKLWPELEIHRNILMKYSDDDPISWFLQLAWVQSGHLSGDVVVDTFSQYQLYETEDNKNIKVFLFEDIIKDPIEFLKDVVKFYGYEVDSFKYPDKSKFTFEALSKGRKIGDVDKKSHFRSGNQDEWKKNVPKDIVLFIKEHYKPFISRYYKDLL